MIKNLMKVVYSFAVVAMFSLLGACGGGGSGTSTSGSGRGLDHSTTQRGA